MSAPLHTPRPPRLKKAVIPLRTGRCRRFQPALVRSSFRLGCSHHCHPLKCSCFESRSRR